MNRDEIIEKFDMKPHPEGGYFSELYRSRGVLESEDYDGPRNYLTCIYFLLTGDNFSAFHKIKQDEVWNFYLGDPIEVHEIDKNGVHKCTHLGSNLHREVPQYIVPGGNWFGSRVSKESRKHGWALVGCSVAPGFDFKDFELAGVANLISKFPEHKSIILQLTRPK
jgi:hypothetical protein